MNIYFLELNQYSVLPMLFFRLIGYTVYFLDCGQCWKKKTVLNKLSNVGLIWMSHQEYGGGGRGFARDLHDHSMRIGRRLLALESFQRLIEAIGKDVVLQPSIYQRVFYEIRSPLELIHLMQQNPSGVREFKVWLPNTIITRSLLDAYPGIRNLCSRVWTLLERLFYLGGRVAGMLLIIASRGLNRFFRNSTAVSENNQSSHQSEAFPPEAVEVAYFPHLGAVCDRLFIKDHFYSLDKDSPFFYEKVCHIELDGNKYITSGSLEYYRAKNIKNFDWRAIPFNQKIAVMSLIQFFGNAFRHGFGGLDIDLLIKHATIVWAVQTSMLRLQTLPNLKIVLIGYDILFPQSLSAACRLMGIKTVAVQERMIPAWWGTPMLIDHYFVVGPAACDCLKSTAPPGVSFYELGPVRLKDHAKARVPEIISILREKYSWIVLAMDFHSEMGWFENGRAMVNNWRSNMIFYDHLLKLCNDFPDAFFLLKGKNTDFTKIPFYKERVGQFRAQPNLLILEDQELWTPFSSVASADIAVVRQNSLADEMLALGKPVIFDDYDGFPSEVYDYGHEVIAYDYDDIKSKFTRFFVDPEGYNQNLNALRKKLYSVPAESVERYLHKELMNIWNTVNTVDVA